MISPFVRRGSFCFLLALLFMAISVPAIFLIAAKTREGLPPGRNGMPGNYIQADGLDIHYQIWGPESGPDAGLVSGE